MLKSNSLLRAATAAVLACVMFFVTQANAATVNATSSVTFSFDVTVWPNPTDLAAGTFGNNDLISCPDPNRCLGSGKSIRFNFSNSFGGSELGSKTYTNTSAAAQTGFSGGIFGPLATTIEVPNTSLLFITLVYVDDEYEVEFFRDLYGYSAVGSPVITSRVDGAIVNAVPLPAALPLLLSALSFFGFMGWRRKRLATA